NGSRQRHSSPSSLASGSSTDETGPPHRIPDSPDSAAGSRTRPLWLSLCALTLTSRSSGACQSRAAV
ncbi:hypothetical protein CN094_38360, partial [Sinorhizobium meliloti]